VGQTPGLSKLEGEVVSSFRKTLLVSVIDGSLLPFSPQMSWSSLAQEEVADKGIPQHFRTEQLSTYLEQACFRRVAAHCDARCAHCFNVSG
jgi:hypothetical protein